MFKDWIVTVLHAQPGSLRPGSVILNIEVVLPDDADEDTVQSFAVSSPITRVFNSKLGKMHASCSMGASRAALVHPMLHNASRVCYWLRQWIKSGHSFHFMYDQSAVSFTQFQDKGTKQSLAMTDTSNCVSCLMYYIPYLMYWRLTHALLAHCYARQPAIQQHTLKTCSPVLGNLSEFRSDGASLAMMKRSLATPDLWKCIVCSKLCAHSGCIVPERPQRFTQPFWRFWLHWGCNQDNLDQ